MTMRWAKLCAACFGLVVTAGAGALFVVYAVLDADVRVEFLDMLKTAGTLLTVVSILALAFCGLLAQWINNVYFVPLRRYAGLVDLIAGGNPALRIDPDGPVETRELAIALNGFAARHHGVLREVAARVEEVNSSLARERSHLAALMSDLAQGVVVCNADGRILLYNEQARRLFSTSPNFIGLGRSLYDLLDGDTLMREYRSLRDRLAQREFSPVAEFTLTLHATGNAQARMAPVNHEGADTEPRPEGFVLLLMPAAAAPPSLPEAPLPGRPVYYDFDLFHQPGQTREIDDQSLQQIACTAFDTETTGLEPSAGDEIISIGAIRIINGKLLHGEIYQQLVDPQRAIDPDSARVHGITPAMLRGKPLIGEVLPVFHRFCEGTVLLGHNAAFDMRFLQLKEASCGVRFTAPVLDTLLLSAVLHGDTFVHRLDEIAARLGVEPADRHTALGDAVTTARVFLKLIPLLAARGITTLREAREASARTVHARIRY